MKNLNDIKELDKKELNAIQGGKGRVNGKFDDPPEEIPDEGTPL